MNEQFGKWCILHYHGSEYSGWLNIALSGFGHAFTFKHDGRDSLIHFTECKAWRSRSGKFHISVEGGSATE
jgi:hypothetical protein